MAEARAACSSSRVFSLSPGESVLGWRILSVRRKGCGFFFIPSALCLDPVLRPQQNGLRRRVVTQSNGVVCYDADFTPFGGELAYTNACPAQNNYKFEGKERDTETGNDDFGARYYTRRFGRWLSADWSAVPVAVPYANLTNPQTLNLYAMVADDPESFADLDGHQNPAGPAVNTADPSTLPSTKDSNSGTVNTQGEPPPPPTTATQHTAANQQPAQNENTEQPQRENQPSQQNQQQQPDPNKPPTTGKGDQSQPNPSDQGQNSILKKLSDFSAGAGDTLTFGLTALIREKATPAQGVVSYNSGSYVAGFATGVAVGAALGKELAARPNTTQIKLALHGADHAFGRLGKLCHIQLNVWKAGVSGSGRALRIPLPW